ncbi:MAG: 2-oxo acid dehydrogenase subunit E2 [Candidatus Diapherotrites archaeon]|uniref:2-oxo acid dehydrogenase subunit E2 n=1 Tax=Candidatus Iainarchaeum sp. TaxID=3101447 RepID=A0A8T4LJ05_9ARCH|nr:2-oxo acid dehydrogenase subunit E2 [Candidatus Diapherotrites archaeon]
MAFDFKFPDVGEGIHEGELVEWLVKEGDVVKADQAIANVETDKAVVEIPCPKAGTVLKLHAKVGDTIKVGEVLVTIGSAGEKYAGPAAAPAVTPPAAQAKAPTATVSKAQPTAPSSMARGGTPAVPGAPKVAAYSADASAAAFEPMQVPSQVLAMPHTRQLARELGVDIKRVPGTGPAGRITDEDVKRFAGGGGSVSPQAGAAAAGGMALPAFEKASWLATGEEERVALKGLRKKIAENMSRSNWMVPTAVQFDEVDVSELVEAREKEKARAERQGVKLTYLAFIAKAVAHALKEFPYVNASLDEGKQEIVLKKYYNVGIAVDTPDGLMVPVVKDADQKSILEIAKEISEKAALARERKIALGDLRGGTFTITNIGSVGGIGGIAVVNYPEVAILALGTIRKLPRVVEDRILLRHVMNVSLSFDHRVVDGALAARFVNEVKKHLEDPYAMLLEVI